MYNDNIKDLLALSDSDHTQLRIKLAEHNPSGLVDVDGAVTENVRSAAELLDLFQRGSNQRTTASTKMNAEYRATCVLRYKYYAALKSATYHHDRHENAVGHCLQKV